MKKIFLFALLLPFPVLAQTVAGMPALPSDASTWTDYDTFNAGMIAGFVLGATGFLFRLVRQTSRQNPEM